MKRRSFLGLAAGAAACGFGGAAYGRDAGAGKPNLRVGILSDIHVTHVTNAQWLEKALRQFDREKVDAVAITGDLALSGSVKEIGATAETWWKVFPGNRRSDGAPVEKLIITGNHDVTVTPGYLVKTREQLAAEGFYCRREEAWRQLFREDYKPIVVKTVKGYTFVMRNWLLRGEENPLPGVLAATPGTKAGKPFFYLQHDPIADTVNSPWMLRGAWWTHGQDMKGVARKALQAYPNCVALSGHSHFPLNEEESIWQGAFTAVNCGCARGNLFTGPGRENGANCDDFNRTPPFEMENIETRGIVQMMVMDVFDDRIVFRRRDLKNDEPLDEDWVVPLYAGGATVPPSGVPKYDLKARAAALGAPVFAADAKVTVEYVAKGLRRTAVGDRGMDKEHPHPQLKVSFPPIVRKNGSPARGFDFTVKCLARTGDVMRGLDERRVYSPNCYFAESRDVEPCWCNFPVSALPNTEDIAFEVTPYNVYGKPGKPIRTDFARLKKWCAKS